jgi:serine phosphatase RsbU (regulator of sigma subunit)
VTNPGLRLHVEEQVDEPLALAISQLEPLLGAFEQATGWEMRYEQSALCGSEVWSASVDGCGQADGRLTLARAQQDAERLNPARPIDLSQARPLALAIGGLLSEINRLRHSVWQREAELAAGVPVLPRDASEPHLADRLEAVLKGGAEAVGCVAAGLYLLDETTSELKLRACWGLSHDRLLAPARPLRGAMADLEALVGHAVVLEDTSVLPHWRCPEEYPAAVCVPVSSPSIPLGTLWVFSEHSRDFTPQETNLLEIIAGRLAADLEREMLLAAGAKIKQQDQQLGIAARWQSDRLPGVVPLFDDYEVAGWMCPAQEVGGDFYDWSILPDGRLSLVVGDAEGTLLDGALCAATLQTAVRAHAAYRHNAGELVARVNESLVSASCGDQRASLAYALVDHDSGEIELALAGDVAAMVVGIETRLVVTTDNPALGQMPEIGSNQDRVVLQPGESLILISGGVRKAVDAAGLRIGEAPLASLVAKHLSNSADGLVARVRKLLESHEPQSHDLTVVVLKRRAT